MAHIIWLQVKGALLYNGVHIKVVLQYGDPGLKAKQGQDLYVVMFFPGLLGYLRVLWFLIKSKKHTDMLAGLIKCVF